LASVPLKKPLLEALLLVLLVPVDEPVPGLPVLVPPEPLVDPPEVVPLVLPELPLLDPLEELEEELPLTVMSVPQSSFVASNCVPRYKLIDGFCSGLVTPNGAKPGPTARMSTRRGIVPAMTNPMIVLLPLVIVVRAETFSIGAAAGIPASPNVPVVVFVPVTVVKVPPFALVNIRFVVVAGDVAVAG
jgi:hypothetical protein